MSWAEYIPLRPQPESHDYTAAIIIAALVIALAAVAVAWILKGRGK